MDNKKTNEESIIEGNKKEEETKPVNKRDSTISNKQQKKKVEDLEEMNNLDKILDNLYFNLEESKKTIAKRKKEILEQKEKKKNLLEYIKLYTELISNNNELIKVIDTQVGVIKPEIIEPVNYCFKDNLFEGESSLYNNLMNTKLINKHQDTNTFLWLKKYEVENDIQILSSEKIKFMKFCSNIYQGVYSAVHLDSIKFTDYQFKIDEIVNGKQENISIDDINPEKELFDKISIKVYFKQSLSLEEIRLKTINLNSNIDNESVPQFKLAFIEYNHNYEITKKYSVLEIMTTACKYYSIDPMRYFIVDREFRIWPYDLIIYNEIVNLNIETYGIKPHCRFFQFNQSLNEKLVFVIINKLQIIELLKMNWNNFRFVSSSAYNNNSYVAKHMMAKLQDIKDDPALYRELSKIKEQNMSENIKKIMSNELLKLLKEIESKKLKKTNTINTISNQKKGIDKIKEALKNKYSSILNKLNMDIDGLIKYYEELEKYPQEGKKKILQMNNHKISKRNQNGLEYFVKQIIESKDTNIIPQKYLKDTEPIPVSDEYFYLKLINYYIHMQKQEIIEIEKKKENNDNVQKIESKEVLSLKKQRVQKKEEQDIQKVTNRTNITELSSNLSLLKDDSKNCLLVALNNNKEEKIELGNPLDNNEEKIINQLKRNSYIQIIIEILLIISFVICDIYSIGQYSLTSMSGFQLRIENAFNKKSNCLDEWKNAHSFESINSWLSKCLIETIESNIYSSKNSKPFYSLGFDIKISNRKVTLCNNYDTYNITFSSIPNCIQEKQKQSLFSQKQSLLQRYGIEFTMNYINHTTNWYNSLLTNDKNIVNSTLISIFNLYDLNKFNQMITSYDKYQCLRLSHTKKCDKYYKSKTAYYNFDISLNNTESINNSYLTKEDNQYLLDLSVPNAYIETFFINENFDLLSIITFSYSTSSKGISTKISEKMLIIGTGTYKNKTGLNQYKDIFYSLQFQESNTMQFPTNTFCINYSIFLINIILLLLFCILLVNFYLKYRIQKQKHFIRNNIFFIIFFCEFTLECFYLLIQKLNHSNDFIFPNQLILNNFKFKGALNLDENLKILKGIGCFLLFYQILLSLFTFDDLLFISIIIKTIFQRFLFLVVLFQIGISLLLNLTLGSSFSEYSSFSYTLWRIMTYTFGINHEERTNLSLISMYNINLNEIFVGILVFIRNIIINFTLIIVLYYLS